MSDVSDGPLTQLLGAARAGDQSAARRVWEQVEPELRRMAARQLAHDGIRAVLHPSSLVSELYLKMVGASNGNAWVNHRHFFAAAAGIMRCIRVDRARKYRALKRGGGVEPGGLDESGIAADNGADPIDELALDEALDRLKAENPRAAEVVQLRYYGSHSRSEIAQMLEIAPRTVDNVWRYARSWLFATMTGGSDQADLRSR